MLQFRYLDNRLKFSNIAPYLTQIYGGKFVHDLIWTPIVYVSNEPSSAIMASGVKDILISIDPSGMVILNTRFVNKTLNFFNTLKIYHISNTILIFMFYSFIIIYNNLNII